MSDDEQEKRLNKSQEKRLNVAQEKVLQDPAAVPASADAEKDSNDTPKAPDRGDESSST